MVFWRGLGALGFVIMVLGAVAGAGVGATLTNGRTLIWIGFGVIAGSAASFALGWYLNVIRPASQVDTWAADRKRQLDALVYSGQFQLAPGVPQPSSLDEANAQASQLLEAERAQAQRQLSNIHTLYFMPLQWASIAGAVLGVGLTTLGLIG